MWKILSVLRNGSPIFKSFTRTADSSSEQLIKKRIEMRREVLNAFKRLHRARQVVFEGDQCALTEGRAQINEHFRKNKTVEDEQQIKAMVQLALDVEKELRTNVIQAVEKSDGVYELRITEETTKLDNVSFDPYAIQPKSASKLSRQFECCGGSQSGCHSANDKKIV